MEELKRCPFCGGEAKLMKMGYPHWVYCEDCGARVHGRVVGEVDGERASIEAWNRRAKNPKEQVQVLADLNGVERAEMARWLADHGQKVDGRLLPERKTGTWEVLDIRDYAQRHTGRKVGKCPFCGYLTGEFRRLLESHHELTNFCPECGAKLEV